MAEETGDRNSFIHDIIMFAEKNIPLFTKYLNEGVNEDEIQSETEVAVHVGNIHGAFDMQQKFLRGMPVFAMETDGVMTVDDSSGQYL